jgi:hypothetical protein
MKQIAMNIVLVLTVLALAAPLAAQGGPNGAGTGTCCVSAATPPTADETQWLQMMREEEKLARDVYAELYAKWKLRAFDNIARSESRHFDSIGVLVARYGVADPAASTSAGVYVNADIKALYYQLIRKGMTSLRDALEVGVLIERHDIDDLESALKATAKTDVKTVYTNLLAGSLAHLDAYETNLEIVTATP